MGNVVPAGTGTSAAYNYINGTRDTSRNPRLQFNLPNRYQITLTAGSGICVAESVVRDVIVLGVTNVVLPSNKRYCDFQTIDFGTNSDHRPTYNNNLAAQNQSYQWTVTGGTHSFVNGTSATSAFPVISFTQHAVYTVSLTYTNSCGSKTSTQLINIDQPLTANAGIDTTVCFDVVSIPVLGTSTGPVGTRTWSSSSSGTSGFSPNNSSAGVTYTFSSADKTNLTVTLTYALTPAAGSVCPPVNDTRVITSRPENKVTNAQDLTICGGQALAYAPTATYSPSTFTWTSTVLTGTVTGNTASGSGNITDVLVNNGPGTGTVRYTVVPRKDGCNGPSSSFVVTVKPTPRITANTKTDPTTCGGSDGTITLNGLIPSRSYTVTYVKAGTGTVTVTLSSNAAGNLIISGLTQGSYINFQVTLDGCASNIWAGPVALQDPPLPEIPTLGSNSPICAGSSLNLTSATVTAGVSYSWTGPNSFTSSAQNPTIANASTQASGNYILTITKANCSVQRTINVTVNPTPEANDPGSLLFCNGTTTTAINLTGTPVGTVYGWTNSNTAIGLGASGSNTIPSFTTTNGGTTQLTGTITITPTFTAAGLTCTGTAKTFTIRVQPTPTVNTVSNQVVCNGAQVSAVNFSGAVTGTAYGWTNNTPSIGLSSPGTGNIAAFTGGNTGNTPVTATIIVTPQLISGALTCSGSPRNFTITVNPTPIVNVVADQTVCNGAPVAAINFGGAVTGTVYNWTNNTTLIGLTNSGAGTIASFTAVNSGTTPVTATIRVTPEATNAGVTCTGSFRNFTITVNPTPTVNVIADQAVCAGSSTSAVNFSGAVTGTTYDWTNSNASIGLAASGTGNIAAFSATNNTNAPITGTITVTPKFQGCNGTPKTFTIQVNPRPVVAPITATICSNNTFNGTPSNGSPAGTIVPSGTTYTWGAPGISPAGSISGASAQTAQTSVGQLLTMNAGFTTDATVTYTVTPTSGAAGNCVGAPFTVTVTVKPQPGISDRELTICSGQQFTATPTGVPSNTTYTWPAPSITPSGSVSGTAAATAVTTIAQTLTNNTNALATVEYTITPTAGTCGNGTFKVTVRVNPKPNVGNVTQTICSGDAFTVTPANGSPAGNLVPANTGYTWTVSTNSAITGASGSNATGTISQTLTNTSNTTQQVVYTVTPKAGDCSGSTFTITVDVAPRPRVANKTLTVCSGAAFSLTPANGGGDIVPLGTTYTWSAPTLTTGLTGGAAGTNAATISGNLSNSTNTPQTATYTITPKTGNCEGTPFTLTVTINPTPKADPVSNQVFCVGAAVPATSITGVGSTTYNWTNSNASIGLAASANAVSSVPAFTAANTTNAQISGTVSITPVHVNNGVTCTGTPVTYTIRINPAPSVDAVTNRVVCNGSAVAAFNFTGTVSGSSYSWTNSQTSIGLAASGTGNIASFTAVNTGTAPVVASLQVTPQFTQDGVTCTGTARNFTITVNPTPTVNDIGNQTLCAGTATTAVSFGGTVNNTVYDWTNSNTAIGLAASGSGNIAAFTATNSSNAPITATITVTPKFEGCNGTPKTFTMTVNPRPVGAAITATICSNNTFNGTPVNGTPAGTIVPANTTYTWGAPSVTPAGSVSGTSAQNGQTSVGQLLTMNAGFTSDATVTYTVTPTSGAAGSCVGSNFTVTVTVKPQPGISDQQLSICSGTQFDATPSNVPSTTTYTWNAPALTPAGTPASAISGASAQSTGVGVIRQTLTNNTNAPVNVVYSVLPTAGSCGSNTVTITVTVNPRPAIGNYTQTICSGETFTVAPANNVSPATLVPSNTQYSWTVPANASLSGEGDQSTLQSTISQTLTNTSNTRQTITYTVTPKAGDCAGASFTVTVHVDPRPRLSAQSSSTCSGVAFTYTPTATGTDILPVNTTYSWSAPVVTGGITGGAAGSNAASISGNLTNPTSADQTATYTVTPKTGNCEGQPFQLTITVKPTPRVTAQTVTICSGTAFALTLADAPPATVLPSGTRFSWGAPAISPTTPLNAITGGSAQSNQTSIGQPLTNNTNAVATATYTVTPSVGGCDGQPFTVTVTVNPRPLIDAQYVTTCSGSGFNFTPANAQPMTIVPSGTTYSWSAPTVSGGMTGGAAGSNAASISGNLTNPTTTAQLATYIVTPTSGTCVGDTFHLQVTVNPQPGISDQTATLCSGAAFTVNPANAPLNTRYTWPAPVVNPAGAVSGGSAQVGPGANEISQTLTNNTSVPATVTYTVTPTAGSCGNVAFTVTVTVNPKPVIGPALTAEICSEDSFTVAPVNAQPTTIVPSGTTYTWTNPVSNPTNAITGGQAVTTGRPVIGQRLTNTTNATATLTYTVTPRSGDQGNCVGGTFTVAVTVRPKATIGNKTVTVCSGAAFTLTPAHAGSDIVPGGTTYSWSAPVVTGGLTGGAAGNNATSVSGTLSNPTSTDQTATYTVTPRSSSCDGQPFTVTVTVKPTPRVTPQTATICSGASFTISLTDASPAIILPAGTQLTWTVQSIAPQNTAVTGAADQTAPTATISQTLTNNTNGLATVTYVVTPRTGDCIGAPFTVTVTVNPKPVIGAQEVTTCSNTGFTLAPANGQPTAATIVPAGTTYSWSVPVVTGGMTGGQSGSSQLNVSGNLTNPTNTQQTATYTVTPVSGAAGNCPGAPFTLVVKVNPQPGISAQADTICSGGSFSITPPGVPTGTTYTWQAPVANPAGSVSGGAAGTAQTAIAGTLTNNTNAVATMVYTVSPTAGSCSNASFTVTITVNPKPVIGNLTADICSADSFTVAPVNAQPGTIVPTGTTYTWTNPTSVPADAVTGGTAVTSGRPVIGQRLTNTTNTSAVLTYTVTPKSGDQGECVGSTFTVAVTVRPKATISNKTSTVCSGGTFTVAPANGNSDIVPGSTTYSWPAPVVTGGMTGGAAATDLPNITGTLVNPTSSPQTAIYTVTPKSGTCVGESFTVTVTVNPTPRVTNRTDTICSGATFNIPLADNPPANILPTGTKFTWSVPVISTGGNISGATAQPTPVDGISQTLVNNNNTAATVTYTVTPVFDGCTGAPFTVTITVNPKPVIRYQELVTCSRVSFSFTPQNGQPTAATIVPAGTTYSWNAPVVTGGLTGGLPGNAQTGIGGQLTNPTNDPQTATYLITPVSGAAGACVGDTFSLRVTVNPQPGINDTVATICSGGTFSVTPSNVPANTTYTWSLPTSAPAGAISGGAAQSAAGITAVSGTLTNTTNLPATMTYTVSPAAGSCTNVTFRVEVTVNPKPVIGLLTADICATDSFDLAPSNAQPTTIVPAGTTYTWTNPVSNPLGAVTGGSAQSAPGRPTIGQRLNNGTSSAATLTYTVTPKSGAQGECVGEAFTVRINVRPRATIAEKSLSVCSGVPFTLSPTDGSGGDIVPSGTIYSWSTPAVTGGMTGGAAGSNQANVSNTLVNPTSAPQTATYWITPTSGTCTGDSFKLTVTVNPTPVVGPRTDTICSGAAFGISLLDAPPGTILPAGTRFTWAAPTVAPAGSVNGSSAQAAPGATTVSQTLINVTNAPATVTYTVIPSVAGCAGASFPVTVRVNPKPVITRQQISTCSQVSFSFTPQNGQPTPATIVPGGTTYSWDAPVVTGGMTGGQALSGQTSFTGNLLNPTTVAQTALYIVTPVSGADGACVGDTFSVLVTVNPQPGISDTVATICSGASFSVTPANVPSNTTYTWPMPTAQPASSITGGAAQSAGVTAISGTLTNQTNTPATMTYVVSPAAGPCTNVTFQVVVTVNPKPVIGPITREICSTDSFDVAPLNAQPGTIVPMATTYTWTNPVSNPAGAITGGAAQSAPGRPTIGQRLTNTNNTPATITYTVTPTSGDQGACVGAPFTVTTTVLPRATIADKSVPVCSGATFTLNPVNAPPADVVPANTTYSWTAPVVTGGITGAAAGADQAVVPGTLTNPTSTPQTATYTVTPKTGNCVGVPFTVTVTVNPTPKIGNQTAEICSGSAFSVPLTDNPPATILPVNTRFTWTAPTIVPAGSVNGASAQTTPVAAIGQTLANTTNNVATVTYTVTPLFEGCAGTPFTVTVTVNPRPNIPSQAVTICSGGPFLVTPVNNPPSSIVPSGTVYSWPAPVSNPAGAITDGTAQNGQSVISQVLTNNTINLATATYTVTPVSGGAANCVGTPFTVTVTVKPQPTIRDTVSTICSDGTFNITPPNVPSGTVYTWIAPVSTPAGAVTGGSAQTAPVPTISQTLTNLTNAPATLTYTVRPQASDCSNSTFQIVVTVNPKPVINAQTAITCTDVAFDIAPANNQPTQIVPAATTYTWTNPVSNPAGVVTGGSVQTVPQPSISQVPRNATQTPATLTYTITPVSGAAGNCPGAPFQAVVTVNPDAKALFLPRDTIECPPFVITPATVNLQTYPAANAVYSWFANGNLIGTGTTFPGYTIVNQNDSIDIKLVTSALGGCKSDSMTFRFFTFKLPQPDFTLQPGQGCGPLSVLITNTTPYTNFFQYQWNFGNGQSSTQAQPGTIVFQSNPNYGDTTYYVTLRAWNDCDTVELTKPVSVASKPKAIFTPTRTTGCSPMRVEFINTSLGIGNTYTWIWDDGTVDNIGTRDTMVHVFNTPVQDTFYVKLVATNQCGSDTATYAIVVSPNPIRLLMAVNGTQANGCAPHTVQFINNTLGATGFQWDFGDGNTLSTVRNNDTVTHTYLAPGNYTVRLTAFNGCTDTTMFLNIRVFPKPTAAFVANRYTACLGDSILFTNNSAGATSYLWQFGDGNVSQLVNPGHTWSTPGVYNVKLIAYRLNGPGNVCSDSVTVPVQIVSSLPGQMIVSDSVTTCVPFTVTFTNANLPAAVVNWNFGDGNTGTGNVVTHTYQNAGTYVATLTSLSPGGCTYTAQKTIRVNAPAGTLTYPGGIVCGRRPVRFDATVSGTDTLIWNFGNGVSQTTVNPSTTVFYSYPNPGLYVPSVTLASNAGCRVLVPGRDTIKVDRIVAGFTASQNRVCGSTTVTFTDTSNVFFGICQVRWDFGDNTQGVGRNPQHTYTVGGTYNIRQIVISNSGCSDTVYRTLDVVVFGIPRAAIEGDTLGCARVPTTFTANVQSTDPIAIYQWTVNGTVVSSVNPFVTNFTAAGQYDIRLVVGTSNGCFDTARHRILVRPSPIVTASNDRMICVGSSVQLTAFGQNVVQWNWTPSQGLSCINCPNPVATPTQTTTYIVEGRNSLGCPGYDTVTISVQQRFRMDVSPNDSICIGDTAFLLASGATRYEWSPNINLSSTTAPNPMAWPTVTTRYRVIGYDGVNCFTDTAFVTVAVGLYPTVNLGPDLVLATGTNHPLVSVLTNGPIRTWQWSPARDLSCANCPVPVLNVRNDATYTVIATTPYGCSASDTINIKAFCKETQVYMANAFSPDGDGINDRFWVQGTGIARVKNFRIFNRWGQLVFERNNVTPNDPAQGWDGRVGGVPANPDVFVYTVEVLCENGVPYTYKGNVTILK